VDADLLADDSLACEVAEDRALRRRVDRGRLVAALTRADDRLPLGACRQLRERARDIVARRATGAQPIG
jgi:hypothetical protein